MKQPKYDVIIVLGWDVYQDGSLPKESINRAKKAAELYKSENAEQIIFTGKVSYSHNYQPIITEAKSMSDIAIQSGVPEAAIILEERARDTEENAEYSKLIVDKNHWRKLLFVTGKFQIERQRYICQKIFGDDYDISFIVSENGLSQEELESEIRAESDKWQKYKEKEL
ncbi:MAG: hypothetical protein QG553_223 [Patescibacteria group bacterium]|nr:hypothetical protein [Patescibacteria group bacterium]